MAIRLLSDESVNGNLQFTGSDPTAIELFKVGSQLYGATVGDLS